MNKVEFQHNTGKYTLLGLTKEVPPHWKGSEVSIAGEKYDAEIVYDLPNHIAVMGSGEFVDQEVVFI